MNTTPRGRRIWFDPNVPKVLLHWGTVEIVTPDESDRLRAEGGARWLVLAEEPYDATERGEKLVEVRDLKPWLRRFQPGAFVVLDRAYRGRAHGSRLLATIAQRLELPNLAPAPADWIRDACLPSRTPNDEQPLDVRADCTLPVGAALPPTAPAGPGFPASASSAWPETSPTSTSSRPMEP